MRRWIWASLAATLVTASSAAGRGAEKSLPQYEGRLLRRHEEQSRKSRSDQLRFERARIRARERMAREVANERAGYSPLRPFSPNWGLNPGIDGGPFTNRGNGVSLRPGW